METGQGHGIEGRFGGLLDPYGNESNASIVILPVPFDKTSTYMKGSDKGPAALIEASRNLEIYDIETDSEVYLKGIYTDKPIVSNNSKDMLQQLYQRSKEWLSKNKFLVTLGGEHTISYAPIKAHAEHYGSLSILQLDAHTDLVPAYENNPLSHASVMARVKEIPQVKQCISVGIRSMSPEELPFLKREDVFFAHNLEKNWVEQVVQKLKNPVYITLDLDVFDPSLMPSTGTPEPGGLYWHDALHLLRRVIQEKNVVGFDVVELLPNAANPGPEYTAAKLVYKLLSYKFKAIP